MPLTPNYIGDSPFQPGVSQDVFLPDQLIGGDLKIVTKTATYAQGAYYKRGTVLGLITATTKYTTATSAAADGSQVAVSVAVDDVDATLADALGGIYQMAELNERAVLLGVGMTLAIVRPQLEAQNIYLKPSLSAGDPT